MLKTVVQSVLSAAAWTGSKLYVYGGIVLSLVFGALAIRAKIREGVTDELRARQDRNRLRDLAMKREIHDDIDQSDADERKRRLDRWAS